MRQRQEIIIRKNTELVEKYNKLKEIIDFINENYSREDCFVYDKDHETAVAVSDKYKYDYESGASKIVYPYYDNDYVVKVPLKGEYSSSKNEETGELSEENYQFDIYEYNYCDIEYKNYKKAIEFGVEKFFFGVKKINDIIYLQDRCDENCEYRYYNRDEEDYIEDKEMYAKEGYKFNASSIELNR